MTEPLNTVIVTITTTDRKEPEVWESVPVSRLVGLCASRNAPVDLENGNADRSYMQYDKSKPEGLFITDVSPYGHVSHLCEWTNGFRERRLDPRWKDKGWFRAPDCWCDHIPKQQQKLPRKETIITINSN